MGVSGGKIKNHSVGAYVATRGVLGKTGAVTGSGRIKLFPI